MGYRWSNPGNTERAMLMSAPQANHKRPEQDIADRCARLAQSSELALLDSVLIEDIGDVVIQFQC